MISYNSLESLYRKETKGWSRGEDIVKEDSPIHAIKFHRLILDEAHSIKSRTTGVAKACFALEADYKWCLSGTPVQNRIGEFFSLLRFLNCRPFACYFCKQCACAELHWEQDKQKMCTTCKHSGFNHVSVFNQEILNPITGADDEKRSSPEEAEEKRDAQYELCVMPYGCNGDPNDGPEDIPDLGLLPSDEKRSPSDTLSINPDDLVHLDPDEICGFKGCGGVVMGFRQRRPHTWLRNVQNHHEHVR